MPNNGHITLCPYYRDEKNKSISCDDIFRSFRYPVQKKRWMKAYCDAAWEDCPHAKKLNEMYDRVLEGGADMETEILKHNNAELTKELKSVKSMLGKSEKNNAKKDDSIAELRKEKDQLVKEVAKWKNLYEMAKTRCKEIDAKREEQDVKLVKYNDQAQATNKLVQGLTAYIMHQLGKQKIYKSAVNKWLKNNNPQVISGTDYAGAYWTVIYNPLEKEEEDEKLEQK